MFIPLMLHESWSRSKLFSFFVHNFTISQCLFVLSRCYMNQGANLSCLFSTMNAWRCANIEKVKIFNKVNKKDKTGIVPVSWEQKTAQNCLWFHWLICSGSLMFYELTTWENNVSMSKCRKTRESMIKCTKNWYKKKWC